MRAIHRVGMTMLGAFVITTSFASTASAGCTDRAPLPKRLSLGGAPGLSPSFGLPPAVATSASGSSSDNSATVVGMWHVTFTSDGNNVAPFFIPDGAPLDDGYAQWHSDGTEIMNSLRDPATSNFCLGVWQAEGGRTYKLNHFALSWDNTGALCVPEPGAASCFVGRANIREEVTVDPHGQTYSGTVTIDQYGTSGQLLFRLRGLVSAQRITAD